MVRNKLSRCQRSDRQVHWAPVHPRLAASDWPIWRGLVPMALVTTARACAGARTAAPGATAEAAETATACVADAGFNVTDAATADGGDDNEPCAFGSVWSLDAV